MEAEGFTREGQDREGSEKKTKTSCSFWFVKSLCVLYLDMTGKPWKLGASEQMEKGTQEAARAGISALSGGYSDHDMPR